MKIQGDFRITLTTKENKKVFGKGPYIVLLKVKECGSLNKAARELNMSYSKAFNMIKNCEQALNKKLLIREIGGVKGGGSTITEECEEILKNYEFIVNEMDQKLSELLSELDF